MPGDNRKSFRILTPTGREGATLRVGKKQHPVRLVDESAGGYAIGCQQNVKATLGDVLQLRTAGGLHEVRVVRCEQFSDGVLVGVERIRDLDDPQQPAVRSSWLDYLWSPYIAGGPVSGGGLKWGTVIGLFLAACGLLAVGNFMATYRPPRMQTTVLPGTEKYVEKLSQHARRAAAQRQAELEQGPQPATNRSTSTLGSLSKQWQQASRRIASGLKLSPDQERQIDAIVSQSGPASSDKDAQIGRVLTLRQASQWRQLEP